VRSRRQERLGADESLLDLLRQATDAAARTSLNEKRIVMGRVLAQAVLDQAVIDEVVAMLGAISRLEAVHFHFLGLIKHSEPLSAVGTACQSHIEMLSSARDW
jgi:hypothetical protein